MQLHTHWLYPWTGKISVSFDRIKNPTPEFSFSFIFLLLSQNRKKTKNAYFLKSSLRLNNISFCITFSYCHISMLCFGNTIDFSMYDRKIFFVMHWEYWRKLRSIYIFLVFVFSFSFSSLISSPTVCAPFFFSFFFQHMHTSTHRQIDEQQQQQHHISELHKGMMIMKSLREQTIRCH